MRRIYIIIGIVTLVILISLAGFFTYRSWQQASVAKERAAAFAKGDITLYLYDRQADTDAQGKLRCDVASLMPVQRNVGIEKANINYALALVLAGDITEQERAQGYLPVYPLDFVTLTDADFSDTGMLTLSFTRAASTTPDTCTLKLAKAQLEKTLTQFPSVKSIQLIPATVFGSYK